jgi:hypothetical protein
LATPYSNVTADARDRIFGGLELALGDRVQLQQVILNHIMNGIETKRTVMRQPQMVASTRERGVSGGLRHLGDLAQNTRGLVQIHEREVRDNRGDHRKST